MADPVTLHEFLGILVVAMGGREGVAAYMNRRQASKNGYITEKFCRERHRNLEKLVDEVRQDVKEILAHTRTNNGGT